MHTLCRRRRRQNLAMYNGNASKAVEDQDLADLGIAPSQSGKGA